MATTNYEVAGFVECASGAKIRILSRWKEPIFHGEVLYREVILESQDGHDAMGGERWKRVDDTLAETIAGMWVEAKEDLESAKASS